MTTPLKTIPSVIADFSLAYPLDEFYAIAGQSLPPLGPIDGEAMPEPYRGLLVHQNDMTPTLEKFYQRGIHLRVLSRRRREDVYFREVILLLDGTEQPVEFGAIKINLALFADAARAQILEEKLPLGHILEEYKIPHTSQPRAFLRMASDRLINEVLKLSGAQMLYGRRNTLLDPQQRPLAEIVEILPVASRKGKPCENTFNAKAQRRRDAEMEPGKENFSFFISFLCVSASLRLCVKSFLILVCQLSMNYDVILIGAGPAGSSAAALLAEKGHRVLVLEREKFPRYHIGESLLPFTYQPLQRLGLLDKMKQSAFVKKYSVQFVSPSGRASLPFYFFDRYDRETIAQTWQVLRSEFDQMLLDNARAKGAEIREETIVKELIQENGRFTGVRAQSRDGTVTEYRAPLTLDCTGKEAFSAVRNNWRVKDPLLNKVAVWTYYQGALRDAGIDEGATTVAYVPEKGWFWYIPQHRDMISVGVVAEGKYLTRGGVKSPEEIFQREVGQNQWIKQHLAVGRQVGNYFLTSEYSHHAKHCGTEGLLLVGDAFAFLDPVFSSGVMLALKSGVLAADAVHRALVERNFSPGQFVEYASTLRTSVENMRKLVYAFYNPDFSFRKVIEKYPAAAGEITDCLSGDVNKDFTQLWQWISEFVPLPENLPVGEPLSHT